MSSDVNGGNRGFSQVDTITLQFSKSEWEDILAYQKMNPGKNLAELAEEFILKLTDDIENGAKYKDDDDDYYLPVLDTIYIDWPGTKIDDDADKDDDYALPVIGNIAADRFIAGDTIPWKVKPRKNTQVTILAFVSAETPWSHLSVTTRSPSFVLGMILICPTLATLSSTRMDVA